MGDRLGEAGDRLLEVRLSLSQLLQELLGRCGIVAGHGDGGGDKEAVSGGRAVIEIAFLCGIRIGFVEAIRARLFGADDKNVD